MYYLMNKDKVAASFIEVTTNVFETNTGFTINSLEDKLPFGFESINDWIDKRSAGKHNKHLQKLLRQLNCADREGFIRLTHAASINDTFWIRSDDENTCWNDISLYRNDFTETVSRLAFEGIGLYNEVFSASSPELTADGHFRKCFIKEEINGQFGSDIFIYKRGLEFGKGLEPYCEMLSSEIAKCISPSSSVRYDVVLLHDKIASKCNLFTNEKLGYAAFSKVQKDCDLDETFQFFANIGSEQEFREMMVIDALCFNRDRHTGNFGVLFDNDTLETVKLCPVYDLNLTLLSYADDEDILDDNYIADEMEFTQPRLGRDFTEIGQQFLKGNETIRNRVRDMCDFKFDFRGDKNFTEERVERLEHIIQMQARALLNEKKLFITDVFNYNNDINRGAGGIKR